MRTLSKSGAAFAGALLAATGALASCQRPIDAVDAATMAEIAAIETPKSIKTCRMAEADGDTLLRCDTDVIGLNDLMKANAWRPRDETGGSRRRFDAEHAPDWWQVREGDDWLDLSPPGRKARVAADVTPGRKVRVYVIVRAA